MGPRPNERSLIVALTRKHIIPIIGIYGGVLKEMLHTFPLIPGFGGPYSLKDFFSRCFGVEVQMSVKQSSMSVCHETRSCGGSMRTLDSTFPVAAFSPFVLGRQRLYLESTGVFAVIVYVSQAAPPAPPLVSHICGASAGHSFCSQPHFHWSATAMRSLATKPFTHGVLQNPLWSSLFSQIGSAATCFLLAHCALIVQYEPHGGGLQVLGPPLHRLVSTTVREGKRERSYSEHHPKHGCLDRAQCHQYGQKRPRPEREADKDAARGVETPPSAVSSSAQLGRIDVSRQPLFGAAVAWCCDAALGAAVVTFERWMEELWLRRHPASLQRHVSSTMRPVERRRVMQQRRCKCVVSEANHVCTELPPPLVLPVLEPEGGQQERRRSEPTQAVWEAVDVPDVVLGAVFPFTLRNSPTAPIWQAARIHASSTSASIGLSGHLRGIIQQLLTQCSRANLRGAALRHTSRWEDQFRLCVQARKEVYPSEMVVGMHTVVAYLRGIFERFTYCSRATHSCTRTSSFWGVDASSARTTMDVLCATLHRWLSFGRRGAFPLHAFLAQVPVGRIPWLQSFNTTHCGRLQCGSTLAMAASAASHPRARRSMLQQRVFLQVIFFLTQHVIPFFVRRSFHVTWGSKSPNNPVFIPQAVWRPWLRREVQKLLTPSPVLSLNPITGTAASCAQLWRQAAASPLGMSLLYSFIRFLPDQAKLRPIAVIRQAHVRSLTKLARGFPSVHSMQSRRVQRLRQHTACAGAAPESSPRGARKASAALPLARSALKPNNTILRQALLCLKHGLAERRRGRGPCHRTPQEEYAEIRSFLECFHFAQRTERPRAPHCEEKAAEGSALCLPMAPSPVITVVRGDAARCYDRLSQEAVLRVADELVAYSRYYVLSLDAIKRASVFLSNSTTSAALPCSRSPNATPRCSTLAKSESALPSPTARDGTLTAGQESCAQGRRQSLYRQAWSLVVSEPHYEQGILWGIPEGWIVAETPARCGGGSAGTVVDPAAAVTAATIEGSVVREVLKQHLREHVVVIDSRVFVQHTGIAQGSAVAMLLCDALLEEIDGALAEILVEHDEPSLLLRRVDDILVATLSPVAGQRCWQAMLRGWPEAGYICQPAKLLCCTGSGTVPWCGLLLHVGTGEVSVEWGRIKSTVQAIEARAKCDSVAHIVRFTHELVSVLRLRTPLTALCRRINRKPRVVQTFYEIGLVWSRLALRQVEKAVGLGQLQNGRALVQPLRACLQLVRRLRTHLHGQLVAQSSGCEVSQAEADLCIVMALHRTLQGKLRRLLTRLRSGGCVNGGDTGARTSCESTRFPSCHRKRRLRERCIWWGMAEWVSHRLSCMLRRATEPLEDAAVEVASQYGEHARHMRFPDMSAAALLAAWGPQSISQAAAAVIL